MPMDLTKGVGPMRRRISRSQAWEEFQGLEATIHERKVRECEEEGLGLRLFFLVARISTPEGNHGYPITRGNHGHPSLDVRYFPFGVSKMISFAQGG